MLHQESLLLDKLSQIEDLPSLPDVVLRVEGVIRESNSSARDVAAVIESDPAMVSRILKVANSAFYGPSSGEIGSVQQAVARLGMLEIRRLCFAIGAMRLFVRKSPGFDYQRFWNHCATTGETTRTLCSMSSACKVDANDAYVAGLLHEIGVLVLDQFFSRVYTAVKAEAKRTNCPIHLVEQEHLHTDHAAVGAILLERWKLPAHLVSAVQYHHDPEAAPEAHRALCRLVCLADLSCTRHHVPGPGEEYLTDDRPNAWSQLGLAKYSVNSLRETVRADAKRCAPIVALFAA